MSDKKLEELRQNGKIRFVDMGESLIVDPKTGKKVPIKDSSLALSRDKDTKKSDVIDDDRVLHKSMIADIYLVQLSAMPDTRFVVAVDDQVTVHMFPAEEAIEKSDWDTTLIIDESTEEVILDIIYDELPELLKDES